MVNDPAVLSAAVPPKLQAIVAVALSLSMARSWRAPAATICVELFVIVAADVLPVTLDGSERIGLPGGQQIIVHGAPRAMDVAGDMRLLIRPEDVSMRAAISLSGSPCPPGTMPSERHSATVSQRL